MKIITLVPIWKRPELTEKFLDAFLKLKSEGIKLKLFGILSRDDPDYTENGLNLLERGILFETVENRPLGKKKTLGLRIAVGTFRDYDYVMELGSDDFLNPEIFNLYKPYLDDKVSFFGIGNSYMYNGKKCIWVKEYAGEGMTFGGGRMIHRNIIEYFDCDLWDDYNEGLDTMSRKKIHKHFGEIEKLIDVGEHPYILGVKTATHICPFEFVEKHLETKEVDFETINKYFGYEQKNN